MTAIHNVSAVFFDMDGTLIDSEMYTGQSVARLCREFGINNANIDCSELDGVSWEMIAQRITGELPQLAGKRGIPRRLHEIYHQLLTENPPPLINKARETVIAARALMPTAIVSSSHRESIEETIRRMEIETYISFYAGAEDYDKAKPAPDGYLKAAEILQVDVNECLVFEDSITGLQAARNAGMQVVAITQGSNDIAKVAALSDMTISDFSMLEDDFFNRVKKC